MRHADLTVACVCVGTKYDLDYVSNLYAMVTRNLSLPHEFAIVSDIVTYEDNVTATASGTTVRWIPAEPGLGGWWQKMALFKPGRFKGRVLYFDLDVVIVDRVEELAIRDGIIADWHYKAYNSSVMSWKAGDCDELWERRPMGLEQGRWHGDQDYISAVSRWPTFPAEWCVSYRTHATAGPPRGAKVVCFHGSPKPREVAKYDPDGWVARHWLRERYAKGDLV